MLKIFKKKGDNKKDKKEDVFEVVLEQNNLNFYPGEEIRGHVHFDFEGDEIKTKGNL